MVAECSSIKRSRSELADRRVCVGVGGGMPGTRTSQGKQATQETAMVCSVCLKPVSVFGACVNCSVKELLVGGNV